MKVASWILICAAACAGGYVYGRRSVEPRVVERVVRVYQERKAEARVEAGPATVTIHRTRTVQVPSKPRQIERVVEKIVEKRGPTITITKEGEVKTEVVRETPAVPKLPDWSATVGAGIGWDPAIDLRGPLVIQGSVERRIVGELWGGVWASTQGAVGVQATYRW